MSGGVSSGNGHDLREHSLAILAEINAPAPQISWTQRDLDETLAHVAEGQKRMLRAVIGPLLERIKALEEHQREFRYCGVWAVGSYKAGNFVTHDGSLWHCDADNADTKPGTNATAWTLCAKRGRDASEPRLPTSGRAQPQQQPRRA